MTAQYLLILFNQAVQFLVKRSTIKEDAVRMFGEKMYLKECHNLPVEKKYFPHKGPKESVRHKIHPNIK